MAIAVPTGIKIFNWLGTMWGGKAHLQGADAFLRRFFVPISNRRLDRHHAVGVAPFDWQLGNSYFVVAHFHYVIDWRIGLRYFRRALLLVPQDVRAECTTRHLASGISGCSSSAST